jgi:protein-tyrosine phosphatase
MSDTGRIDVHAHLLPGLDDGSSSPAESIALIERLIEAGYTHATCTPHLWPGYQKYTPTFIAARVRELQSHVDAAGLKMKLFPGCELNIDFPIDQLPASEIPTYANLGKHALFDFWHGELPHFFWRRVKHMQQLGIQPIVAHPERIEAFQDDPDLIKQLADRGLLFQANLQCLDDPPQRMTRQLVEQWLTEKRYFMLGSDTHNMGGIETRMRGLQNAIKLLGEAEVHRLTVTNPRTLFEGAI